MSRYPAMSQAAVPYDRSLLAAAPAVTREERQAGYDVNALERGTYPQPATTAPTFQSQAPVGANPFQDGYYDRTFTPSPAPPPSVKRPWWKRKRWAALALIIFIGIICGVIAGVVTARNSRNSSLVADSQNAASAPAASNPSLGSSSPLSSQVVQSPTTTNNGPIATRTTLTEPAATTTPRGGGNPGTTIVFGTNTLPPGVSLPTATAQDPPTPSYSNEIPLICYVTPTSRQCAPYFEDDPVRV